MHLAPSLRTFESVVCVYGRVSVVALLANTQAWHKMHITSLWVPLFRVFAIPCAKAPVQSTRVFSDKSVSY